MGAIGTLFGSSKIEPRDARYEGASMLGGQLYNMPTQAAADTAWQDYFSGARQNQFNRTLFGGGAQSTPVSYYNSATGQFDTQTVNTPASAGMLGNYGKLMSSLTGQSQSADQYGSGIMSELQRQALAELQDPYALSAAQTRSITQAGLSDPALSSFGMQPLNAYRTYGMLGEAGQNLANQRRQFASGVAEQGYGMYTQPSQQMAGNLFTAGVSDSMNATPNLFDPYSQYGMDLSNTVYNSNSAAKISDANRYTEMASPD